MLKTNGLNYLMFKYRDNILIIICIFRFKALILIKTNDPRVLLACYKYLKLSNLIPSYNMTGGRLDTNI